MTKTAKGALRAAMTAAVSTAVLMTALPALAQAEATQNQQEARRYDWNIPAQPLSRSISVVTETAGIQLFYNDAGRGRVRAPAVRGRFTVDEVLTRLTAGTGLTYRYSSPGVITIEHAPRDLTVEDDGSRVLGPVRVEGSQSSTFAYSGGPARGDGIAQLGGVRGQQDEEASGYRPNVATVGGIAPVAIEDIPRSVSVLTQEQIEKQNIHTIGDALRRLPGVAVIESGTPALATGARVVSRGFDVTRTQLDGGASRPLNIVGNGQLDLAAYERVELVRGPNSIFSGGGSPGGSLNLVRKRPGGAEALEITGTLGSFDRYGVQLDYSTPSLHGSPFAFRGVAAFSDQQFYYAKGAQTNALFYGIVDAPLGDKARFELGLQYTDVEQIAPYSGLFRYTGGDLITLDDYYLNFAPPWAGDNHSAIGLFSRLYINVRDDLDLQVGLDYERGEQDRRDVFYRFSFIEGSGLAPYGAFADAVRQTQDTSNLSFDIKLAGKTRLLGLDHAWFVAGELTESGAVPSENFGGASFSFTNVSEVRPGLDASAPNFLGRGAVLDPSGTTTRAGLVIGDVISWRDRVELSLSARRYFSETSTFAVSQGVESGLVEDIAVIEAQQGSGQANAEWAPSWSLAFKPFRNITLYGTRAEGREELSTPRYTVDGDILGPSTYENLEAGVKFATDRWLATLAYYDITQENVAEDVPGSVCPPSNTAFTPCYLDGGATIKSKGVDFELTGELFTGLNIAANYTWAEVESTVTGLNASSQTPVEAAQLFVDWSPSSTPRTSFRAGARYRGEVFESGYRIILDPDTGGFLDFFEYAFTEEPYLVFDLGVRHQLTDRISLDVYAENVTDEQYLSTISAFDRNFPGAPRTVTATLRWTPAQRLNVPGSTTGLAPFGDPADWYGAVETGLHASADLDVKADGPAQDGVTSVDWTFETEDRAIALARIGYRVSPKIRAEIEGAFRNANFTDIGGGAVAPFGVCSARFADRGAPFNCNEADGDLAGWSLMVNGLYDFGSEDAAVRPFVGVGLGVSLTAVDFAGKMEGIGLDTPWEFNQRRHAEEGIGGSSSRVALAYQLLAGVSWQVTEQATIDATWRYHAIPDLSWGSYNLDGVNGFPQLGEPWPALTPRLGDFSSAFTDHSLTVGLRWAFGVR